MILVMDMPTQQQFEQILNQSFNIQFNDNDAESCELIEINNINAPQHNKGVNQFSIIFKSNNSNIREQGVYQVTNESFQDMSLFLVPVFGDDKEVHYEAVFA